MFKKEKNDNSDQIKKIVEKNKITLIENRGKVELDSEKLFYYLIFLILHLLCCIWCNCLVFLLVLVYYL